MLQWWSEESNVFQHSYVCADIVAELNYKLNQHIITIYVVMADLRDPHIPEGKSDIDLKAVKVCPKTQTVS